jgi:hypothetical protein
LIETIDQGAIGTAGPGAEDGGPGGSGPSTPAAVVEALAQLGTAASGHPVNQLLSGLAAAVGGRTGHDPELDAALVVELARRYLQVVRDHERGVVLPRVWQVVLDSWGRPGADPRRIALAGVQALVGHDLPAAVVSTCTLLGRTPGPAERGEVEALVLYLAGLAGEAARDTADAATLDDASGLELLLNRGEAWRQAEHLWSLRGRPSEAERYRSALDWRAALVARGVLAGPA